MDTPNTEKSAGASGCEGCSGCDHSHETPRSVSGGLCGWPLATAAFFVFVLPLVLAILGAVWVGRNPNTQLLGALAGFVVGVLLAVVVARILRRQNKNNTDSTDDTD